MIEFRQGSKSNSYHLFHNGEKVEDISIRIDSDFENSSKFGAILSAENRKAGEVLISLIDSEPDFPVYERLVIHNWSIEDEIKFHDVFEESEANHFVMVVTMKDFDIEESEIEALNFITGLKNREFLPQYSGHYTDDNGDLLIRIDWEVKKDREVSFLECLKSSEQKIRTFCESARSKFLKTYKANFFSNTFSFPHELKIPCEQYLLYFAQFLQDLGINATSSIKEEAGRVLFSVIPNDDIDALDKIREALAVYLNLPSSPIVYDDSFAAMRLQAEIERLQSSQRIAEMEFRVAQKALGRQDKIIHQQANLLEQQAKVIEKITNPKIMIDSAENKDELEKIYEGLEVGESKFIKEQIGIKFNPAKIIKTAVKNTFGKGDEIIELGLNKKD